MTVTVLCLCAGQGDSACASQGSFTEEVAFEDFEDP